MEHVGPRGSRTNDSLFIYLTYLLQEQSPYWKASRFSASEV